MSTEIQPEVRNLVDSLPGEVECEAKLRQMFRAADMLPAFPLTSNQLSELLRENGYAVPAETLEDWARRNVIPGVPLMQGRYRWNPQTTLAAGIHATTWRMFVPLHPAILHQLSAVELEEMKAQATGGSVFVDAEKFSVRMFLQMLETAANQNQRHMLAVALRGRLDRLGVLDK